MGGKCDSPRLLSNSEMLLLLRLIFGDNGLDVGCNTLTTFDDEYSSRLSLVDILFASAYYNWGNAR